MPRPPQLYNGLSLALQASGILASAAYNPVRVELERLARTLPRHPQIVDLFTRLVRDSFGFVDANGDDSAAPAPSREDIVQFLEERFPDALLGWGDEEAFFSADADSPGMERIPLNLQLCQALVRDPNQVGFARTNCLRFLFWVAMVHAVARTMYRHFLRIHTQTRAAKCSLDGDSPGWAAERQLFGGILGVEWREEDVDDFERVDQWLWTPDGTTDTPLAISAETLSAHALLVSGALTSGTPIPRYPSSPSTPAAAPPPNGHSRFRASFAALATPTPLAADRTCSSAVASAPGGGTARKREGPEVVSLRSRSSS